MMILSRLVFEYQLNQAWSSSWHLTHHQHAWSSWSWRPTKDDHRHDITHINMLVHHDHDVPRKMIIVMTSHTSSTCLIMMIITSHERWSLSRHHTHINMLDHHDHDVPRKMIIVMTSHTHQHACSSWSWRHTKYDHITHASTCLMIMTSYERWSSSWNHTHTSTCLIVMIVTSHEIWSSSYDIAHINMHDHHDHDVPRKMIISMTSHAPSYQHRTTCMEHAVFHHSSEP